MDEFERELKGALRRVAAPRDFAERVCAVAAAERPAEASVLAWPRQTWWTNGALAAGLVMGAAMGMGWHGHRVAERKAVADREFETAMRVTDKALENTREQLGRSGLRLFNE